MQFHSIFSYVPLSWYLYQTCIGAMIPNTYDIAANNNNTPTIPLPIVEQATNHTLSDRYYYFLPNKHFLELDLLSFAAISYLPARNTSSVLQRASKVVGKKIASVPLNPSERFEIGADRTLEPYNEVVFTIEPIRGKVLTWGDVSVAVEGIRAWLASATEGIDKSVTTYFYYEGFEVSGAAIPLAFGALEKSWRFPPDCQVFVTAE